VRTAVSSPPDGGTPTKQQARDYWELELAVVLADESGGVLSLAGVLEAWLSLAAWMMTVLVLVEVRPFWSVVT
jgi:hypothetical protein